MWWSWLPVAQSEPPNGGGDGRFKWLWMRRTRLLVPDGLLVLVFHTLLLIRWDFHRVATVPGSLQFSEKWGKKKKKPGEQSETTSWRSKIESMYRSRPLGAELSFHPNCLWEKSAVYCSATQTDQHHLRTISIFRPNPPLSCGTTMEWRLQTLIYLHRLICGCALMKI